MQDDAYIITIKPKERGHQARDTVLTLVMWGLYVYLWIPLITFGAWLVGFERFYEIMIVYGGLDVVMNLLDWYALAIILIAACIVSWSGINYHRFHNKDRRYAAPSTEAGEISAFFSVLETEVDRVKTSRRLLIELDELGYISEITHYAYVGADDRPNYVELE